MTNSLEVEAAILEVQINGQNHNIRWPRELSLVDAMLEAGLDAPFACKSGKCAACACQLVSGEVEMEYNEILTDDDVAEGLILGCQSRPATREVKIEF